MLWNLSSNPWQLVKSTALAAVHGSGKTATSVFQAI